MILNNDRINNFLGSCLMVTITSKVIIGGDFAVGKTTLVKRFLGVDLAEGYKPTIGVDIGRKVLKLENHTIVLQIWDLSGQPTFKSIRKEFYTRTSGGILVYDVSRRESFQNISKWTEELLEHSKKVPIALVANKIDLRTKSDDPVSTKEGESLSNDISHQTGFKSPFIEASALFEQKNLEPFLNIARVLLSQYEK